MNISFCTHTKESTAGCLCIILPVWYMIHLPIFNIKVSQFYWSVFPHVRVFIKELSTNITSYHHVITTITVRLAFFSLLQLFTNQRWLHEFFKSLNGQGTSNFVDNFDFPQTQQSTHSSWWAFLLSGVKIVISRMWATVLIFQTSSTTHPSVYLHPNTPAAS